MSVRSTTPATQAKLFRGLGDSSRLAILDVLTQGPSTVTQLVALTQLSQPNVSNHLSCLLECGLVARRRDGRFVVYALADDAVETILETAKQVTEQHLSQLDACRRYNT